MSAGNDVFISYSHADRRWLDRLHVHLAPFERNGAFSYWDDTRIQGGALWQTEIEEALARARVAILLVSPDFLASRFIAENELPPLLEAAERKGTVILSVIIRPCTFEHSPLTRFQAVNPPSQPLNDPRTARAEKAFAKMCGEIARAFSSTQPVLPARPAPAGDPASDPRPAGSAPAAVDADLVRDYRAGVAVSLRRALEEEAARTEAAASGAPIAELFWVPTLVWNPDPERKGAGWRITDARGADPSGAAGDALALSDAEPERAGAGGFGIRNGKPAAGEGGAPEGAGREDAVIFGEAGAGKSMLSRILTLGLVEETGLAEVTDALPAPLCERDLPVLIDLRRFAGDLLAAPGDADGAVRRCALQAWGPAAAALLESETFAARGLIVLDGIEAILWAAWDRDGGGHAGGAVEAILRGLFRSHARVPRVITMRHFGERWLKELGRPYAGFEIAPLTRGDVRQLAGVHFRGRRHAVLSPAEEERLGALTHNRDLRRFASSPMFVRLALELIGDGDEVPELRTDQIFGHLLDQIVSSGRGHHERRLPLPTSTLRELLRALAYRVVASGGATLSPDEVLECGAALRLTPEQTRGAARWLGERTEIVALADEPGGGLSFIHDWFQEALAAEELAARHTPDEIVALAAAQRWHDPVKWTGAFAPPETARAIAHGLLDAGRNVLAAEFLVQAAARLREPACGELLERFEARVLDEPALRLPLITALAQVDTPSARRSLVRLALPLQPLSTRDALERYVRHEWKPNDAEFEQDAGYLKDRLAGAGYLFVAESRTDGDGTVFVVHAGEPGTIGGGIWASASVSSTVDPARLPVGNRHPLVDLFGKLAAGSDDEVLPAVAEAALAQDDVSEQRKLVALALCVERLAYEANPTAEAVQALLDLLLRGLRDIARSESPALTIGMLNAVFTRVPEIGNPRSYRALGEIRRAAILEYEKYLLAFYRRTGREDGYWCEPPAEPSPGEPPPPTTEEVLVHMRAAIRESALRPPVACAPPFWKSWTPAQSWLDGYTATVGHLVHKLKAKDTTGRWAYYFVLVPSAREPAFLAAIEGPGTIDLEDYGVVVASCYGERPDDDTLGFLRNKYKFDV